MSDRVSIYLCGRPWTSWRVRSGASSQAPGRSPATTRATPPTRTKIHSLKGQSCICSRKAAALRPALQPGRPAKMAFLATKTSPRSRPSRQAWHSRGALQMQSLINKVRVLAQILAIQRSKSATTATCTARSIRNSHCRMMVKSFPAATSFTKS